MVYPGLSLNISPVFPISKSLKLEGLVAFRSQILIDDYDLLLQSTKSKMQCLRTPCWTFTGIRNPRRKPASGFAPSASVYVRLQTLEGVQLLEPIQFSDIDNKLNDDFSRATAKTDQQSDRTLAACVHGRSVLIQDCNRSKIRHILSYYTAIPLLNRLCHHSPSQRHDLKFGFFFTG